jgi:hypothetical protein
MKAYRFFFHYNKPASQAAGEPRISVHYRNTCHIVGNVSILVPTEGKLNKTQPRFTVQGWAKELTIENDCAILR